MKPSAMYESEAGLADASAPPRWSPSRSRTRPPRRPAATSPPTASRTKFTVEQACLSDHSGDGEVAIDDYVERSFVPDFLNIDIEESELSALEGAQMSSTE